MHLQIELHFGHRLIESLLQATLLTPCPHGACSLLEDPAILEIDTLHCDKNFWGAEQGPTGEKNGDDRNQIVLGISREVTHQLSRL